LLTIRVPKWALASEPSSWVWNFLDGNVAGVAASVAVAGLLLIFLGSSLVNRGGLLLNGGGSRAGGRSREDLGAGALLGVGVRVTPDAEVDLGVVDLVDTRDLDGVGGDKVAAASDLDLGAAVVELCLTSVGTVETNVLGADEVLAVLDALGDLELEPVLVPGAPGILLHVGTRLADGLLVDLEPLTGAIIGTSSGGSLGHVDLAGAGVLHGGTNTKGHGEGVTSLDLSGTLGTLGGGAKVAAEVGAVRGQVVESVLPLGRHVRNGTGVLANEVGGGLAVDNELVEEVMSRGHGHQARGEGKSGGGVKHLDVGLLLEEWLSEGVFVIERKTEVKAEKDRPSCWKARSECEVNEALVVRWC
jgi:hypothetical protein